MHYHQVKLININILQSKKYNEKKNKLKHSSKPISDFFSKDVLLAEAKDELNESKETEQEINRDDLI